VGTSGDVLADDGSTRSDGDGDREGPGPSTRVVCAGDGTCGVSCCDVAGMGTMPEDGKYSMLGLDPKLVGIA